MLWRLGWRHIRLRKLQYFLIAVAISLPVTTAGVFATMVAVTHQRRAEEFPDDTISWSDVLPLSLEPSAVLSFLVEGSPWLFAMTLLCIMAAVSGGAGFRVMSTQRLRETESLARVGANPRQVRLALATPGFLVATSSVLLVVSIFSGVGLWLNHLLPFAATGTVALVAWVASVCEVWRVTRVHAKPGERPNMLARQSSSSGNRLAVAGAVSAGLGAVYLLASVYIWDVVQKSANALGVQVDVASWIGPVGDQAFRSTYLVAVALVVVALGLVLTIPWLLKRGESLSDKLPVTLRVGLRDVSRSLSVFGPITQVVFTACLAISTIAIVSATDAADNSLRYADDASSVQKIIEMLLFGLSLAIFLTLASFSTGFVRLAQGSRQATYHAVGGQPAQRRTIAVVHAVAPYMVGVSLALVAGVVGIPAISATLMDPQMVDAAQLDSSIVTITTTDGQGMFATLANGKVVELEEPTKTPLTIPWVTVLFPPLLALLATGSLAWFLTPKDIELQRRST